MKAYMKVDRMFKVTVMCGDSNEPVGKCRLACCAETAEERNQRKHDESHARFEAECERKGI